MRNNARCSIHDIRTKHVVASINFQVFKSVSSVTRASLKQDPAPKNFMTREVGMSHWRGSNHNYSCPDVRSCAWKNMPRFFFKTSKTAGLQSNHTNVSAVIACPRLCASTASSTPPELNPAYDNVPLNRSYAKGLSLSYLPNQDGTPNHGCQIRLVTLKMLLIGAPDICGVSKPQPVRVWQHWWKKSPCVRHHTDGWRYPVSYPQQCSLDLVSWNGFHWNSCTRTVCVSQCKPLHWSCSTSTS